MCLDPGRWLLRCTSCGRSEDCTADDNLRYARDGWPRCCREVMTLYVELGRPDPGDLPPPPLGRPADP